MSQFDPRTRENAARDLEAIAELKRCPAFSGWFQNKQKEQMEALARKVLDGPHATAEALLEAWKEYRHKREYVEWMDSHERTQRIVAGSTAELR